MPTNAVLTDLYTFASSSNENDSIVVGITLCGPIHNHTEGIHDWTRNFYGALCIDLAAQESLINYFAPPLSLNSFEYQTQAATLLFNDD